jgi:hypothetical protein
MPDTDGNSFLGQVIASRDAAFVTLHPFSSLRLMTATKTRVREISGHQSIGVASNSVL